MKEIQVERFLDDILKAVEKGVAETNETIIEITTELEFRRVLLKTGNFYKMNIIEAINNVYIKYTEEGKCS